MKKGDNVFIPFVYDDRPLAAVTDGGLFLNQMPKDMENWKGYDFVEYAPVRTGYWVIVQPFAPTDVSRHRCSNPKCRLTTYARRLPPYCQECGTKMLGEVREEDDNYILQSP